MSDQAKAVSQAEFARILGVGRSYVTALKSAGRLVLDRDNKVLVEESKASIARSNGAPERAAVTEKVFSDARDKKEHYAAELSRLDYEERCGKLMKADEVLSVVSGAIVTLRTRLESFPDALAPQLASIGDEQMIRALLADNIEMLLAELSHQLSTLGKGSE
ncbi:DUF1441 family protein [Dechloromonas sp. TW-R-39-2]|uniref:DUF1441 family protein n=1 Tax=Dechloromonas sp. TW-R-39-2 TaxID=2654218 RepID=UPI00193D685D|nr:DUF1441 family protein [Dechloromonas sp. TW-R-39-2]QRM19551.1 DUF1441 family protein [Dechloromonas sp. TW-R-39-2]